VNRIDARKLAELPYTNTLRPAYHEENGVRTLKELARSYLTDRQRCGPRDDPGESSVSELGDSMFREASLRRALPLGMAGQDWEGRRTSAGGVLLPAIGRAAIVASRSAADLLTESAHHKATQRVSPNLLEPSSRIVSIGCN
jgi:hypothetical protein